MMENHYKSGEKAISQISGHYYKDIYIYPFCWYILWQLFIYTLSIPTLQKNAIKCFLAIFWGLAQFFSYFDPIIPLQEFVKFCPKAEEERA